MKNIAGLLVLFGVGSMILPLMGYEFTLMSWIDNWGTNVGWGIKISMAAVGAGLWLVGHKQEAAQEG